MADSPFEITTSGKPKKTSAKGVIIALVVVLFLALGVFVGVLLVRQQQDIRERAQTPAGNCANPASIVQCPRSDGALVSCDPADQNGNAQISLCNVAGRVEKCGGVDYCCPSANGAWTTTMDACTCSISAPTGLTTSVTDTTTATLKWTLGKGNQIRLWVGTTADPVSGCSNGVSSTCLVNDAHLSATATEYQLQNLSPNVTYYWKLISWSREGCDEAAQVSSFTTTGSSSSLSATTTPTTTATTSSTATPTTSGQATATATSTSVSSTKTASPTAKSTASATKPPIPATGTGWATYGAGALGVLVIIASLFLAF